MRSVILWVLLLGFMALSFAEPQYYPNIGYVQPENYFRANLPYPSVDVEEQKPESRFLFTTLSVFMSTSTTTTTTTSIVTCTTSTSALSVCTSSGGRRRRGALLDNKKEGRGLFYDEQEENDSDGSSLLPSNEKVVVPEEVEPSQDVRDPESVVPFVVEPGYKAPGNGRIFLTFGTSITTFTFTTTSTTSLTAICKSTTSFQLCGSSGK